LRKQQQTHLIQSQDGEIHLTFEYLGYDEYSANLKCVGKEEAVKVAKREAHKPLQLQRA
jgi:hypothetical protein